MTHRAEQGIFYLPDRGNTDEVNRAKAVRAIVFSSLGLLATSSLELFVVVLSGSVALLSDALHNLGDVFTTVGVYLGFRASRKVATRRYPYGYGRAEDLAGIVIVAAIWSSAVLAGWQSYDKLVSGRGTSHLPLGMAAAVIGIVGNQLVARYKLKVGREIKSAPLIVDARHSMLDAVASAGALLGLIGVALGFRAADPLAGFAIALLIVRIGVEATRDVVSRLMDANDEEVGKGVLAAIDRIPAVKAVSDLRVRWLGRQVEVRMRVHLPATMSFSEAHDISHQVERAVLDELPDAREVTIEPVPETAAAARRAAGG